MSFNERLENKSVIILDGGTGSEVYRLIKDINNPAWSSLANLNHSNIVQKIHENYINIGCDIITTNTFSACRHVLAGVGLADKVSIIIQNAVNSALKARQKASSGKKILVAGSMSHTFSWIKNTMTFDPEFIPPSKEEYNNYKEHAEILAESGVDIILLEMCSDIEHSSILLEAALTTGLPVWVGLSCSVQEDNSVLGLDFVPDYKPIEFDKIINSLSTIGGEAFGIMHTTVNDTYSGLNILKEKWNGPIMAYPEISHWDSFTHEAIPYVDPNDFSHHCINWIDQGVKIIGGCCGVTINHMENLVKELKEN